jgi:excinuclease ABC subunit B
LQKPPNPKVYIYPNPKIRDARKAMEKAAKELDFMQAAKLRDTIKSLQDRM